MPSIYVPYHVLSMLNKTLAHFHGRTYLVGMNEPQEAPSTAEVLATLKLLADKLRETADELWDGKINQFHAANRLRKIANQIAKKEK